MFVDLAYAGLALASFLPPPVAPEPQGHQVTPQVTEYVIARQGESGGLGSGAGTWTAFSAPCVARVGTSLDLAFDGKTSMFSGVFVAHAATTTSGQNFEILSKTGDLIDVTGIGNDLLITMAGQPTVPALSQRGDKAWFINVTGQNTQVFLTKGPLTTDMPVVVCYEGMGVTDLGGDPIKKVTAPFAIESFGIGANLDIGFHATTTTSTNGSSGIFRWDAQTSTVQLVKHTGDAAEGTSDSYVFIAAPSNDPLVAEFGGSVHGAFRATTDNTAGANIGVWVDDPASGVPLVAKKGDTAIGASGTYQEFRAPAVNSSGKVAFVACTTANCSQSGIWTTTSGSLSKVTASSDDAPNSSGTDSTEDFDSFSNPVLNESGAIAFRATLLGGGEGIWRRGTEPGAVLRRVLRTGDALQGSGVVFNSFGPDIAISDTGELAFTATMSDSKQGLFTTFQLGSSVKIVKIAKEDEFFLWDSDTRDYRTILDILFYPGAYSMGTTGFVQMAGSPAQPQAVGFVVRLAAVPADPVQKLALVLTTVEE